MLDRRLIVRHVRELDLAEPAPGGAPFLSAASGLAVVGDHYLVIADDAHHIGLFPRSGGPGRLQRVLDGDLPEEPAARKREKPDFEAVLHLPASGPFPNGAVLLVGSGSTAQRERAALIPLDGAAHPTGDIRILPLTPLLASLREVTGDDVNIEAGFLDGADLVLVSRGHAAKPENHVARFDYDNVAAWLASGAHHSVPARAITALVPGRIDGVPLGITDAAPLRDGSWLFAAVAEDTADSYNDGVLRGAALGIVNRHGAVAYATRIDPAHKIEGIVAHPAGATLSVLMVTDADDPTVAAVMLAAELPPLPIG